MPLQPMNEENEVVDSSESIEQNDILPQPEEKIAGRFSQQIIGAAFLLLSAIGLVGVFVALSPPAAEPVDAQLAAAAARRSEPFTKLELEAVSISVYDVRRDSEIFSKNSTAQLPLASITKVALVLVAAEVLPLDGTITISREAVARGGGGLTWGEEWNVRDLIDYTLITSSNTGAEALSEAARSLLSQRYPETTTGDATVDRMNALTQQLGMHETYFLNATGLDASATQAGAVGSARDVTQLFAYALRTSDALFARTRESNATLGPRNYPERPAHNTNNEVDSIEGLLMGKTGTTDLAGGNLAVAFLAAPERPIVIVVLGSSPEGRFRDMQKLVAATRAAVAENE